MKIIMVCYSGTSASIARDRMLAWARDNLIEEDVNIIISGLYGLEEDLDGTDIVLVGPQVRCAMDTVRERIPEEIPVMTMDTRDYGMAKGDRLMKDAIAYIKDYGQQ